MYIHVTTLWVPFMCVFLPSLSSCVARLERIAVARGWQDREKGQSPKSPKAKALIAMDQLTSILDEESKRKTSDPLVSQRGEVMRRSRKQRQRCLSDSEKENGEELLVGEDVGDGSSAHGGDSGFHDSRPKPHPVEPVFTTVVLDSQEQDSQAVRGEKIIPHPQKKLHHSHSCDEIPLHSFRGDKQSSSAVTEPQRSGRRRLLLSKHLSLSSLGGSSDTLSLGSALECISPMTEVTDILSGLGFADFDDPQLIPDRFIPQEASTARPSVMKHQSLLSLFTSPPPSPPESVASLSTGMAAASTVSYPPSSSPPPPFSPPPPVTGDVLELPLGATAENFMTMRSLRPASPPPPSSQSHSPADQLPTYSPATDPSISHYHRNHAALETVPEETASDLSPSPRWLSPRVSLDHTLDMAVGQLGTALCVANTRKRSLPNREGYKVSVESLISEQDSIYLSVTSYDDDVAREKEEMLPQMPSEDFAVRKRRKGVYEPPPQLLSWLQQQRIEEEDQDPEEQPWPFSEQAKLRKSLTELVEAQQRKYSPWERPLSPSIAIPTDSVVERRSSHGGPCRRSGYATINGGLHRRSLPAACRFHSYPPNTIPPPHPELPAE